MKTFVRLCFLFLFSPGALFAAEPLRFSMVVLENKEAVIREFSPLLERLTSRIGQPVS